MESGQDAAGLDIHYLDGGSVVGTLIILNDAVVADASTEALLKFIDEILLPMTSFDDKTLTFTVLKGQVIGQFENKK